MTNASMEIVTVDLEEQLRLLEELPSELRTLVQQAPVQVDLRVIHAIWLRFGAQAHGQIEEVFDLEFPNWKVSSSPSPVTKFRNGRGRSGRLCLLGLKKRAKEV